MTEIGKSAQKGEQLGKISKDIGHREPKNQLVLRCSLPQEEGTWHRETELEEGSWGWPVLSYKKN